MANNNQLLFVSHALSQQGYDVLLSSNPGIFYSRWSKNPFTRGSYSNAEVGTTKADFHNLGGKLGKLFFAGDSFDFDWWGFAQGAYFTGERKATEIAQCIKGTCEVFWPKGNFVQEVYINP